MTMDSKGGFEQIMSMIRGFQVAKMLMVAVDLSVFDFLAEPKSAVQTAAWLKADARSTGIFLNGLVGLGLLDKDGDNFRNRELGLPLPGAGLGKLPRGHRQAHRAHLGPGLE